MGRATFQMGEAPSRAGSQETAGPAQRTRGRPNARTTPPHEVYLVFPYASGRMTSTPPM